MIEGVVDDIGDDVGVGLALVFGESCLYINTLIFGSTQLQPLANAGKL